MKRKIKLTYESKLKIKIKRIKTKLEKLNNQDYGSNDEIRSKFNFDKKVIE